MSAESTRRIVLLDQDGFIEEVFPCDCMEQIHLANLLAQSHPGRTLAGEFLLIRRDGTSQWQRFLTVNHPSGFPPINAIGRTAHDQKLYEDHG